MNLDLDEAESAVILRGDTRLIWRNRRVAIYFRDYLGANDDADGVITFAVGNQPVGKLVASIEQSLSKAGFRTERTNRLLEAIADYQLAEQQFSEFAGRAKQIWRNEIELPEFRQFVSCLEQNLPGRRLYSLQLLAAFHLAFAQNAANFSAPGAGKTTIVYGAYTYLKSLAPSDSRYVSKILVIGPLSSFGPWEMEFSECFGRPPRSHRLSGGVPQEQRKRILYSELPEYSTAELILTSYQSVPNDLEHLQHFLTRPGNRVMLVLDEAHKIKNSTGGVWADAVSRIARLGAARVVLTGTPAPNGYEDLYNLFQFIWPDHDVIRFHVQHLRDMSRNPFDSRIERLVDNLSPFFIRIRKSDLGLPAPEEHPLVLCQMGPVQERIYRFIEDRYVSYLAGHTASSGLKDKLVRARLIRLMQVASNPALLKAPLDTWDFEGDTSDNLFVDDSEILTQIRGYESAEVPTKIEECVNLVSTILSEAGENRVVVWCVFVANLFEIQRRLSGKGIESRILYGGTPTEVDTLQSEIDTRESIVREFQSNSPGFRVILANPFAVGESISLHKKCRYAIYFERNFNAAAFLQSKDRIHRYGLPPDARIHYYYLSSADTVDGVVHDRLLQKEAAMLAVMESKPIPLISLNMDSAEDQEDTDDVAAIISDYAGRHNLHGAGQ